MEDEVCLNLVQAIKDGKLDVIKYPLLKELKHSFKELYLANGLIVKGNRVFIPKKFRGKVITASHEGHQGIVKTKALIRSRVWYPRIDKDVENMVRNCLPCQASIQQNSREPLIMTELPKGPWENVAVDFHGPLVSGDYLLVVIDEYSRYPVIEITKSTSAKATIPKLDKIFSQFGIPLKVKSDNGSPFQSGDYDNYAKHMGFERQAITPEYPQANGLVENFNRMLEKTLSTAKVELKNWKQEMYCFLRNYRATSHLTTGKSPAELLFQHRPFRTRIPELISHEDDSGVRVKDRKSKATIKRYADNKQYVKKCTIELGDLVIVKIRRKTKGSPFYDPNPYTVIARKGNMISASRDNKVITRNSSFFKKVIRVRNKLITDNQRVYNNRESKGLEVFNDLDSQEIPTNNDQDMDSDGDNVEGMDPPVRHSSRESRVPARYDEYDMSR